MTALPPYTPILNEVKYLVGILRRASASHRYTTVKRVGNSQIRIQSFFIKNDVGVKKSRNT